MGGWQNMWRTMYSSYTEFALQIKVEKNLKGSLDSIPSPSSSLKIQIVDGKVCLSCEGKTLLGIVNKLLKTNIL